jgi:4-amino-4-deoxychorismate lyase
MSDEFRLFTSVRYDVTLKTVPKSSLPLADAGWNRKHESPFYMLDYHRDRLLRAAVYWQWQLAINVLSGDGAVEKLAAAAEAFISPPPTTPLRFKILVSRDGVLEFERFNATQTPLENLFPRRLPAPGAEGAPGDPGMTPRYMLLLDPAATVESAYTHYKTTRREMYDAARERAGLAPPDHKEVLVVNAAKEAMEGTLTTPFFWRGGQWVTPPVAPELGKGRDSGGQDGTTRRWALENGLAVEQTISVDSLTDGEECWISNGVRGFIAAVVSIK